LNRIAEIESSGRNKGTVLSEAVAGGELWSDPVFCLQNPEGSHTGRQDGRLRILGELQLIGCPLKQSAEMGKWRASSASSKNLPGHREILVEFLSHPNVLRSLSRKNKGCSLHILFA